MKKILSAICPVLSVLLLSNIGWANDFDYSINKYDIDLNFKRNNTIQVKEVIDASFNKERNGISRKLNLKTKNLKMSIQIIFTSSARILTEIQ